MATFTRSRTARAKKWFKLPSFLFDWFPHKWKDPQFVNDLALYEGPFVRAVEENPSEFIRDRMSLYHHLKRTVDPIAASAGK